MKLTLREWRRAKGVTQAEMAELCGVQTNTYRRWEENPEEIKLSNAVAIADRLGVNLGDIFFAFDTTKTDTKENEVLA